ncbi:MAG: selenide, water dikinase SelD [Pseudomonadota bacterium]|nr:selenide, water dikinase SelD [Pseudomonadota bacterium]
MQQIRPSKQLLLVGGGHSHVTVIKQLGMRPIPGVKVTLVTPSLKTPYSGMLPGCIAGHYLPSDIYIDLAKLCQAAGIDWVLDEICGVDPARQTVMFSHRPGLQYDVLSLDVGIIPDTLGLSGDSHLITPVKPIASFIDRWQDCQQRLTAEDSIAIVGGGAASVEIALAIAAALKSKRGAQSEMGERGVGCQDIHLISASEHILPEAPPRVRRAIIRALDQYGVRLTNGVHVTVYEHGVLHGANGASIPASEVIWATGARPMSWLGSSGLDLDEHGYVLVTPTLQSVSHPNVFAAGDTASMEMDPRPKAGVYAVRQGPILAANLRAYLESKSLNSYKPQSQHLALIALGEQRAIGFRNGVSFSGHWVWRMKDRIDRRFLAQFNDWPGMAPSGFSGQKDQMRCLGCGSKVPATRLKQVLGERTSALTYDDAHTFSDTAGELWLQTIDQIRPLVPDLYLLGKIGLIHAASDIYAMGGEVMSVLANLSIEESEGRVADNLFAQLSAGGFDQASAEGFTIHGGHSAEGLETQVGYAVTGRLLGASARSKHGLRVGDVLVLTKPLGVGLIFAAAMQRQIESSAIETAIQAMLQSNRNAVDTVKGLDVSAMTDITGFGLAGHLSEMVQGEEKGVAIDFNALPTLAGVDRLLAQTSVESSLSPHNRAAVDGWLKPHISSAIDDSKLRLLFDPQTSGGLLIGVAPADVDRCLEQLHGAGYMEAVAIGEVTPTESAEVIF